MDTTITTVGKSYWVVKVWNWAKLAVYRCVLCRIYRKENAGLVMGDMLPFCMGPVLAFYNTSMDLYRPMTIQGKVQKRTKGKCWGIVYMYLTSRGVFRDVTPNYSANGV